MSIPEQSLSLPSVSSLSLNDLPIDQPRPVLASQLMSLPHVKRRLQALRHESKKRRKLSRETTASSQHQENIAPFSATARASSDIKGQATVTVVPQDPSPEEPTRKRDTVQRWLIQQAQRLERLKQEIYRHRDSMFDEKNVQKELKLASQNANAIVLGPDSGEVTERVIEHFFTLYAAGGSDWRDSKEWDRHQAKCSRFECDLCKSSGDPTKRPPSPLKALPSPSLQSSSPKSPKSPKKLGSPEDGYFSIPLWQLRSRKRREKGKSPASDEDLDRLIDKESISPRTQLPEYLPEQSSRRPRRPKGKLVIQGATRRAREKPVRCSITSKPLNPSQIPVPAITDLKPADSSSHDLRNPAYVTGRPYHECPLEHGQLPFPLSRNIIPPPTPQLGPKHCNTPVLGPLQLEDFSIMSANSGFFTMSPLVSASPSATNVQRGFRPTIRLVDPSAVATDESCVIADMLSHDSLSMPRLKRRRPSVAAFMHRSPAPPVQFPPTPPDSRQNSNSYAAAVSYTSYGAVLPPAEPASVPEGPADRNWAMCELSDTTGSSLPDCPVYVNPREARDKWWAEMAERHGPGMEMWR